MPILGISHVRRIIKYLSFYAWLFSLCVMFSVFIHRHLGYLCLLAIVNSIPMNVNVKLHLSLLSGLLGIESRIAIP